MELSRSDLEELGTIIAGQVRSRVLSELVPGRWLTLREAMEYAKVKSPNTIRAWIDLGYIYGHKRSGQWIVDRTSIDDWFLSDKVS
jgi:hypothetical protein